MLIPANERLTALRGGTFDVEIAFWEDDAETVPFSLAARAVEFEVVGVLTLTEGHGITIPGSPGNVMQVVMTPEQTEAIGAARAYHYRVRLTADVGDDVEFPLNGSFVVQTP